MEVIFVIIAAALYLLPTIVAVSRRHTAHGAIAVLNVFLGWTFVFWVIALVWACYEPRARLLVEPMEWRQRHVPPRPMPAPAAPSTLMHTDEWHARGEPDDEPLAHCMAHSCYWPACYACNMRAFGLRDEPEGS